MKIHADFRLFAATNFDPSQFIESPAMGVSRFLLDRIGDERARATTIVEYKPNSKFPNHCHIGGEEFLVLKGTFKDQFGEFSAGTYVGNPIGSEHAPWVDDDGCTIFVKLLQMAETGEGITPLHIDLATAKLARGRPASYGTVVDLYSNLHTGEVVEMCWLDAGATFSNDERGQTGEELFVMDGSLYLGDDCYEKWGRLRFPVGHELHLVAGRLGAQVFRKTGHLTTKALSMEKIQIHED